MSNRLIRAARQVETCSGQPIRPIDKAVLVTLADDARDGDDGRTRLATYEVMQRTGLSERGVRYAYKRLAEGGHITRETGVHGFVGATIVHPQLGRAPVHDVHPPGASCAPPGCTTCTPSIESKVYTNIPVTSAGAREPVVVDEVSQVFDAWDLMAATRKLPGCPIERDAAREAAIHRHLRDRRVGQIVAAIDHLGQSAWLTGRRADGQGDFMATFDWVFGVGNRHWARNLLRIIEGEFNRGQPAPADRVTSDSAPPVEARKPDDPPGFESLRALLRAKLGEAMAAAWTDGLRFAWHDDALTVRAPSSFVADWVASNHRRLFEAWARGARGRGTAVEIAHAAAFADARAGPGP